ncbi:UNVERIFIED_CONTAM: hypothetical protein GTU68_028409 [Idotea baltica]|nr:hypothetical protein [Idotea baltica]
MLKQKSICVWMTGLSGSGKSTIAQAVEKKLHADGFLTQVLDGDNIRSGINNNLTFSPEDRIENIRRIAEVTKLYLNTGIVTLNSFISPTYAIREMAQSIIGRDDFYEIYIDADLATCEKRDVKGLYKKARAGEIKQFTGIDAPFEAPQHPAVRLNTAEMSVDESAEVLYQFMLKKIKTT